MFQVNISDRKEAQTSMVWHVLVFYSMCRFQVVLNCLTSTSASSKSIGDREPTFSPYAPVEPLTGRNTVIKHAVGPTDTTSIS